jgi:hypothetical protein
MMNRSQIEKMLMASGGITGEPVQTARIGSYMTSTGGGKSSRRVTQGTTSGGGSSTQRKSVSNIKQGNAESQLNNLVIKSRNNEKYRNEQGAGMNYNTAYDLAPQAAKDFVNRQLEKTGGRLNEAAKARIAPYLTNRTAYQLDLNKFRNASPENEAAYVKRFPKTAAFERMLRQGAEGLVGMPGRIIKKAADTYLDGVKNMVEKISGTDAKNVEIAKDKDADINTIVNNLQRNITKERDDGKARGMTEADLTAMYGDPIDITTGDDIFGADLIGMDELEEDSPLRAQDVAPGFPRADITGREKDVAPGFPKADDAPRDDAPGLDLTAPDDSVDLSGTSARLDDPKEVDTAQEFDDVYGFDSAAYQAAVDKETANIQRKLDEGRDVNDYDDDTPGIQGYLEDVRNQGKKDGETLAEYFDYRDSGRDIRDSILGADNYFSNPRLSRQEFPVVGERDMFGRSEFDDFQDPVTLGPNTAPSFTEAPFEYFPLFEGLTDFDFSPRPRREPETFNTALDELANNTRADGGQIFGNQNMSTFDKLKAIADGIADNK